MDEDDLFVGAMDIDDGSGAAATHAPAAAAARSRAVGDDEDMSEVAEIMLNLKVCPFVDRIVALPHGQNGLCWTEWPLQSVAIDCRTAVYW